MITLGTSAPKPAVQKALLQRYAEDPEPGRTLDVPQLLARQTAGEVGTANRQEGTPDNIIYLEAGEAWRSGRSSLSFAPPSVAVAA